MRSLKQSKRQMIRDVLRSNLEGRRGKAHRIRTRGLIIRWSWTAVLSLSAVLAIPAFVISRGKASANNAPSANTAPAYLASVQTTELAVPLKPPTDASLAVLPLAVKRIVIDAGHGGEQPGAISDTGLLEKDVTLDIALRLERLMERGPFKALLTRESDQTVSLAKRVAFANSNHADLFVSIHINWMEPHSLRPLEIYYIGPSDDPQVLRLASLENQHSGYSLSEYRQLLEKVYLDTRRNESHLLAKNISTELYRSLKPSNPELLDRGVKMAPFAVLVGTQMPAVLAEVSSLSNHDDAQLLRDEQYRQQIALALFKGLTSFASNLNAYRSKGVRSDGKISGNDLRGN
jgi:N-acetylmuramoyl-L-alanine amidase